MFKKSIVVLFLSLILVAVTTYSEEGGYTVKPKFEIEEIIRISKEFASEKNEAIDKYFIDYIKYEASDKNWIVNFQGYIPAPGNHFMVSFNEATEKMEIMLGE